MKQRLALGACALVLAGAAGAASLQEQLVGTWINTSTVAKTPEGVIFEPFGGNTRGLAMFDRGGHFSIIQTGDARKKYASNSRQRGTPEENEGAAKGTLAFYGTYTIDEKEGRIHLKVDGSSFVNWDGGVQVRGISFAGDVLKWSNPTSSSGGTAELTWTRAK